MTEKDLEKLLLEAMQNADKAPANVKTVIEEIRAQMTTLQTQKETILEQEKRIRDLQDTNMKLFLGQTMNVKDEEEKEEVNPVKILLERKENE